MRITVTKTVNIRVPSFEAVCRAMWSQQGPEDATAEEWRAVGIVKRDATAKTIADPVVRAKYDAVIAKLLKSKDPEQYQFNTDSVAYDIVEKLPAKHWISKAHDDLIEKYYPYGF
jgi:hypothetical protein